MAARSPLREFIQIVAVVAALCLLAGIGPACVWSGM